MNGRSRRSKRFARPPNRIVPVDHYMEDLPPNSGHQHGHLASSERPSLDCGFCLELRDRVNRLVGMKLFP